MITYNTHQLLHNNVAVQQACTPTDLILISDKKTPCAQSVSSDFDINKQDAHKQWKMSVVQYFWHLV